MQTNIHKINQRFETKQKMACLLNDFNFEQFAGSGELGTKPLILKSMITSTVAEADVSRGGCIQFLKNRQ